MKTLAINFVLLIFSFNQALAYAPSSEDMEINKALDSLSSELDRVVPSALKSAQSNSKMSERKFNRIKRKSIRKLNREIDKMAKLSLEEQERRFVQKVKKQFKKSRKVVSKLEKRHRLLIKIARKTNTDPGHLLATMKDKSSATSEMKAIANLKESAINHGGYEGMLLEQLKKVQDADYAEYLKKTSAKTKYRKGSRSIASQAGVGDFISDVFAHLLVAIFYLSPLAILIGSIMLLAGGSAVVLLAGLGGTALVFGAIIHFLNNI